MAWATSAEAEVIVGRGIDSAHVAAANAHVSIYANRTPDAVDGIGGRDLYWLRQATAWQAVWLSQQPAVDGRAAHTSLSQDGLSVSHDAEYQIVLAPLAARSLRNLSWKASRSLDVRSVNAGPAWPRDFTNESSDELHGWSPLEGIG